jgi:hypothetical protein
MLIADFRIDQNPDKAELEHQELDSFPVNLITLLSQIVCHPPATLERLPEKLVTYKFKQFQLFSIQTIDRRYQVVSRTVRTGYITLTGNRYRLLGADPFSSLLHRERADFI